MPTSTDAGMTPVELYRGAAECSERAGRPADLIYTNCNIGEILSDQGHLEEAEAHLQRARQLGHGDRRATVGRMR